MAAATAKPASPFVAATRLVARLPPLRLPLCALLYLALLLRCWRLLLARHPGRVALFSLLLALTSAATNAVGTPAAAIATPLLLLLAALANHARSIPAAANPGHRAGAEGYKGSPPYENTLGALRALLQRHGAELVAYASGGGGGGGGGGTTAPPPPSTSTTAYVEIDVRETADGKLALVHDEAVAFFSAEGGDDGESPPPLTLRVGESTLKALRAQGLGDRPGLRPGPDSRIATLEEALKELRAWAAATGSTGVLPRLAVDVKRLSTDAARRRLLWLVGAYARDAEAARGRAASGEVRSSSPSSLLLGGDACCLIAFPGCWEASFGRFGGERWRRWSELLAEEGLSARCVALHTLRLA
jgi:hypothetical protein